MCSAGTNKVKMETATLDLHVFSCSLEHMAQSASPVSGVAVSRDARPESVIFRRGCRGGWGGTAALTPAASGYETLSLAQMTSGELVEDLWWEIKVIGWCVRTLCPDLRDATPSKAKEESQRGNAEDRNLSGRPGLAPTYWLSRDGYGTADPAQQTNSKIHTCSVVHDG